MTFPSAGEWNWSINSGFFPETQPMPALTVLDESGKTPASEAAAPSPWPFVAGIAGLIGAAGGLLALVRTRAPWAAAATLAAVLVGVVGFASASPQATASPPAAPESRAELGKQLFVAKGCVVCHTHDAVADVKRTIGFNFDQAPVLTDYSAAPDYLAKWLDDPASLRPNAYMPDLNLSEDEIGALAAFLNSP